MRTKLVLLTVADCSYFGNSIAVTGGRILPCPITRWSRREWDARTYSDCRLAIVGGEGPASDRKDVTAEIPQILAALRDYDNDDDVRDTITAIEQMVAN